MEPFTKFFTRDTIVKSREKVGFVAFKRSCTLVTSWTNKMEQPRVRTVLQDIQMNYNALMMADADNGD